MPPPRPAEPVEPRDRRAVSVLAYFGDDATRVYQLAQWLPVLELLDGTAPVGVVLRREDSAAMVRRRTRLPVVVAEEFPELRAAYAALDAKVVLYCNNSPSNVDSLLETRMLHVHVNHGESDKHSMASNNAKSYDRVFVAGNAAVQRYATGLLDFDLGRLVRIGRPQLDLHPERVLPPSWRRTFLYAPTWEGDADYNNYSSVDTLGRRIVEAVLALPDARLVYKPHPKVVTSTDPEMRAAHRELMGAVHAAGRRDPGVGHVALPDADILGVMPDCDVMITDVSSVGLDWLYLRTERPLFITDRSDDLERLRTEAPVSRCADVVDSTTVDDLTERLAARLDHDELYPARTEMRHHYFGDLGVGESTARFLAAVLDLVELRDRLLHSANERVAT